MATVGPPPPGYAPQPGDGAPPPQGYGPPPQAYGAPPPAAQQQTTVVMAQPQPQTVIIQNESRDRVNHCLHCVISLFFPPWLFVWCCLTELRRAANGERGGQEREERGGVKGAREGGRERENGREGEGEGEREGGRDRENGREGERERRGEGEREGGRERMGEKEKEREGEGEGEREDGREKMGEKEKEIEREKREGGEGERFSYSNIACAKVAKVDRRENAVVMTTLPVPRCFIGLLEICVCAGRTKPATVHQVLNGLAVLSTAASCTGGLAPPFYGSVLTSVFTGTPNELVGALLKSLPVATLAVFVQVEQKCQTSYARLLAAGLMFSAVGDFCLYWQHSPQWFIYGLLAFALAQLLYLLAFDVTRISLDGVTVVTMATAVLTYTYILPGLKGALTSLCGSLRKTPWL
ncbi:hypothetical protein Bbelb_107990 [Branchiostoma belcheri]|nr:hypothetical protein Bbelb_107990 [Branchiostoma belcheri]